MISCYKNIQNPFVAKEIDLYEYIEQIKHPDKDVLDLIHQARKNYIINIKKYNVIKKKLPCFTLNFNFRDKKTNTNIKSPTGFIYLDLDSQIDIDLSNKLIFVSWKSLSNYGRGVLVRVNGLTIDNFKKTYLSIAKELNIEADKNAAKPTQYCIHSYDKDIYLNNDSIIYYCNSNDTKNTPIKGLNFKKKRKDKAEKGVFTKLRFNNIREYDFNDKDYLYFKNEKTSIASVFIPKKIRKGERNNIISAIAHQIKALNPCIKYDDFYTLITSINYRHCKPILDDSEAERIINKTLKIKELEPILNTKRRFIFNPERCLTHKEKMTLISPVMGKRRSDKTKTEIKKTLENWDIYKNGKVTQKSLQKTTGKNIKTIEKYYYLFKDLRIQINNNFKLLVN